jgi:hypothetical protein
MTFRRFIRFLDDDNIVRYGDLEREMAAADIIGQRVSLLEGHPLSGFTEAGVSKTVMTVSQDTFSTTFLEFSFSFTDTNLQLLSPLEYVPIFQCVGINYHRHAQETNVRNQLSRPIKDGSRWLTVDSFSSMFHAYRLILPSHLILSPVPLNLFRSTRMHSLNLTMKESYAS